MLGPHTKFKLNANCVENSNDKKIGAATVVGRGIKNISYTASHNSRCPYIFIITFFNTISF
jgi:hypothetical protein